MLHNLVYFVNLYVPIDHFEHIVPVLIIRGIKIAISWKKCLLCQKTSFADFPRKSTNSQIPRGIYKAENHFRKVLHKMFWNSKHFFQEIAIFIPSIIKKMLTKCCPVFSTSSQRTTRFGVCFSVTYIPYTNSKNALVKQTTLWWE